MSFYDDMSEDRQFACRVIADHARATAFAIADGILPGNEGRNYVLRKIMRRAIYHGREHLGLTEPFFYKVCDFVVDNMHGAYPELETQREFIGKMVRLEEKAFSNTLTTGLARFEKDLDEMMHRTQKVDDLFERTLRTQSLEAARQATKDYEKELSSRFQNNPWQDFVKLIYEHRVPPYFAKYILDKISNEEDRERFYQNSHIETLENRLARDLLSFIENEGSKDDKEFVREFLCEEYGELAPKNILNQILLPGEKGARFLRQIENYFDNYFSGTEDLPLLSFKDFAKNYDTFGTPRDLIRVGLEDRGINLSEDDFNEKFDTALKELQYQSGIGKTERKSEISPIYAEILEKVGANAFRGYETTQLEGAEVVAILDGSDAGAAATGLSEGQQGSVILNETPFYAESGGQVGDVGFLFGSPPYEGGVAPASGDGVVLSLSGDDDGVDSQAKNHPVGETPTPLLRKEGSFKATVSDTFSPVAGLIIHKVTVDKGSIKVGDTVTAVVDVEKRDATRRNHTATHLVHAALKEVLGSHVKQAGSVVAPNYLRFDFAHYQPMSDAEIAEVEDLVNRYILQNEPVTTDMMALEDAMRSGAVAMFGEKYGSEVRVLSVGDGAFSRELCGGTHVRATGDIGSFKITSDEAIASGVRRIRAITGFDAFERFREDERLIDASLAALNTQRDNLPNAIAKLAEELKRTRKEMDDLKLKIAMGKQVTARGEQEDVKEIGGVKVLAKEVDGLDANGTRQLSDTLLARLKSGVVVLGRASEGKVSIIVRVSDDLTERVKAGNVIKEIVPIVGGKGGGRADMAEGGGTEPEKLAEAIDAAYGVVEKMLR